jgi:hypothetical protein
MFAPKKWWQFLLFVLLFLLFLALIPVVNFLVIAGVLIAGLVTILENANISRVIFLAPLRNGCFGSIMLFLFFLPWNLFLIALGLAATGVPAAILTPLIVIPSYYQNIDSFLSIMKYWWFG